jgi:O-antigen/teichoic acid export membrane protein
MSSFRLILKNLAAIFTSNVISVLVTLITPALFIPLYGKVLYADWLVLSSSVSYLSNLNFGLQTFVNQDLAVRYGRGEREGYHVQQSTALRALLGIALVAAVACLGIYLLPVEHILNLQMPDGGLMTHWQASTAVYFIALQVLTGSLLYGYFGGAFMGVGLAHRGSNWNNAQRFANAGLLWLLVILHQPLYILAIAQWLLYVVMLFALLFDLKRKAPQIFPSLRYWDGAAFRAMLKPSAHFALMYGSNWITYELPLILLQRLAGPVSTVIFSLGRQVFSSGRQVLTGLTQSIGPEITRIFGVSDWPRLYKLYDYTERVIFALIAVVNIPLLVFSPILLHFWLHKSSAGLFDLHVYLLLAITATVICIKEHKMQFQLSTNSHIQFSRVMFSSYLAMVLVAILTIRWYGLVGWVATWLATEVLQVIAVVHLNRKLFAAYERLSLGYIAKLAALAVAGFSVGFYLLRAEIAGNWGLGRSLGPDIAELVVMMGLSWYFFHLSQLSGFIKEKVQGKFRFAR